MGTSQVGQADRARICAAIDRHDASAARSIMAEHLEHNRRDIERMRFESLAAVPEGHHEHH